MKWKDKFNKKYMQISLYVIITAVIIYSLSLIAKNLPHIISVTMDKINWLIKVMKPVILGFVFAYLMDPIVSFFEQKYRKIKLIKIFRRFRAPRTWAAITSVIILMIVVIGLISLLVYSVTDQLRLANYNDIVKLGQDYMNGLNSLYQSIQGKLNALDIKYDGFEQYISNTTNFILNSVMDFAKASLSSISNISGYLTTFIFSFIIGIYFMIDGRMFISFIRKVCLALFSDNANKRMRGIMHDLDEVFSGYIRGQLTDAFFMLVIISTVLSITGVKFAIVIGILSGIGNLIPYFGPIVAYAGTTLACLINGDIRTWIVSMIALFIVQSIDGNLVGPKLLSRSIKIHPLIIIVSLIFGSALGGFLGMLLAVPIGAYVKLIIVRFIDYRLLHKQEMKQSESKSKK